MPVGLSARATCILFWSLQSLSLEFSLESGLQRGLHVDLGQIFHLEDQPVLSHVAWTPEKFNLLFSSVPMDISNDDEWNFTLCNSASVSLSPSNSPFKCVLLFICSAGTDSVAFCKISATLTRSLQKLWMPKIFASSICLVSLRLMFSLSANARLYLSWKIKKLW